MPKKPRRWESQRGAFSAAAVEALISDERIPPNRRTFSAILFLSGLRFSEAAGLRWQDYDPSWQPLAHIHLRHQWHDRKRCYAPLEGKGGEPGPPREIPVHPSLASMLAEWRLSGWPVFFGRTPRPSDIIVPSVRGPGHHRTLRNGLERLEQDCELLDVRPLGGAKPTVTQHECRNTFITLSQAGGAAEAWVRRISHNASGDVLAGLLAAT
jgi:integrase